MKVYEINGVIFNGETPITEVYEQLRKKAEFEKVQSMYQKTRNAYHNGSNQSTDVSAQDILNEVYYE